MSDLDLYSGSHVGPVTRVAQPRVIFDPSCHLSLLPAAMPAKIPRVDLRLVAPSDEEVAAARAILAKSDDKTKRAMMSSFAHWMKANNEDDIAKTRGAERQVWLERFMVHSARFKASAKAATVSKNHSSEQATFVEYHEWAAEEMDINMGPRKGKAWRDAGFLKTSACPVTGSDDEWLRIYHVPKNWNRMKLADVQQVAMTTTTEDVTSDDFEALKECLPALGPIE